MNEYSFYVYTYNGITNNISLRRAIEVYKNTKVEGENPQGYKAIGVTKNKIYSCDLLNNLGQNDSDRISNDYKQSDNFKNDRLITINVISILKEKFNL